jgi:hypothetical protein
MTVYMKYVFRTVLFHFTCILFFGYLYLLSKHGFVSMEGHRIDALDCLFLSTTVQSGVGYALVRPITHANKGIIMLQQFCMLSTNVFLLYFLTQG